MKSRKQVSCVFCPSSMADEICDLRNMSPTVLVSHVAACHLDLQPKPGDGPITYKCDGNSASRHSICSPAQPFKSLAVTSFVHHMKTTHPNQNIAFSIQYKAALSSFMSEFCSYVKGSDSGESQSNKRQEMYNFVTTFPNPNADSEMVDQPPVADAVIPSKMTVQKENETVAVTSNSSERKLPAGPAPDSNGSDISMEDESGQNDPDSGSPQAMKSSLDQSEEDLDESFELFAGTTATSASSKEPPNTPVRSPGAISASRILRSASKKTPTKSGRRNLKRASPRRIKALMASPKRLGLAVNVRSSLKEHGGNRANAVSAHLKERKKLGRPRWATDGSNQRECMKCHRTISTSGFCSTNNLFNHAAVHMTNYAYECAICGGLFRTHPAWLVHFAQKHADVKKKLPKGRGTYSVYMVDNRKKMRREIAKVMKECFDV